jgi:Kef-type K+ transport system membrane component KefB
VLLLVTRIIISSNHLDDLLAWTTLAATISISTGGPLIYALYTFLIAIGFVLFLWFVVRTFLTWAHSKLINKKEEMNPDYIGLLVILLLASAWFAEALGIHAFFGAFMFGLIVPKTGHLIHEIAPKVELLVVDFFLPIFFASSGLRTMLGVLNTGMLWVSVLIVTAAAILGKVGAVTIVTRV